MFFKCTTLTCRGRCNSLQIASQQNISYQDTTRPQWHNSPLVAQLAPKGTACSGTFRPQGHNSPQVAQFDPKGTTRLQWNSFPPRAQLAPSGTIRPQGHNSPVVARFVPQGHNSPQMAQFDPRGTTHPKWHNSPLGDDRIIQTVFYRPL